ncbi:NAD(P)/FAD-dependent oxidoreductase [[Clostridium] innocuum]|nr:NAD(P)/FAD-dependent oxidoreductase [[Clostridium] innocuum]
MNYENVIKSIKIGSKTIKNRFVMPAMDSGTTTDDHIFSDQSIAYFAARAKGGFGLIISEYMSIAKDGIGNPKEVGLWDDTFLPNLKQLCNAIHENNGTIFAQLHHSGMMCIEKNTHVQPAGPSAIASPNYLEPVREYTNTEIYELVEQFAQAAHRVKKAGFDGVEVHGAHGYLIAQFLSKATNKRVDEFGGSYENRFRFAALIIRRIKIICGSDFPIVFRLSAEEFMDAGCTIQDAMIYARLAEAAGADAIHVSTGTGIGGNIVTPLYFSPGFNVENAAKIKEIVQIPVIAVGRINDPVLAEQIIATGKADMISLGRQSVCDPDFPNKVYDGRIDEIFTCTGCMQRCYYAKGYDETDTGISCMINPFSGKESSWHITQTPVKKNIMIVGAGPAGLEAAWILAKRGHHVSVFEKEFVPGGNYRLAAVPPKKQDLAKTIHTYTVLCRKYGVNLQFGKEVTAKLFAQQKPDAIILATGSKPLLPGIPGLQKETCIKAIDVLSGKSVIANQKILLIGGGLVGCETAEFLHMYHNDITIVDMETEFAKEAVKRSRVVLMQRLKERQTIMHANTRVLEIFEDGIRVQQKGKEIYMRGFDCVIIALGSQSFNPLEAIAHKYCDEVFVIGDAKRARDAKAAIYEAAVLGMNI